MYRHKISFFVFFAAVAIHANCQQPDPPSAPEPVAVRRFEVGVQYSTLGLNSCLRVENCPAVPPHNSFGPGVTVNLDQHWSLDASYDLTTGYQSLGTGYYFDGSVAGGRGSKALIDGRFNLRGSRYVLFAYGRTGAVIWSGIESDISAPGTIFPYTAIYGTQAYFAVGAGAGAEYSLNPRVHVRASVGDLVIDYRDDRFSGCSACYDGKGTAWNHNSDLRVGVYAGLGNPISQRGLVSTSATHHRFLDKTNISLLGVNVLAQTADAIGTQHFIRHGYVEQNGLGRPLVTEGWPGQIAGMVIVTSGEALVMYGLHHMGHHRVERLFALAATGPSAYEGYRNLRDWGVYDNP